VLGVLFAPKWLLVRSNWETRLIDETRRAS